jgi:chromosome segregation ATPase
MSIGERLLAVLFEPITDRLEAVMAKVDDLQASVNSLEGSVRELVEAGTGRADALQAELDKLRADDAVEDSKLAGMQEQVDGLRSDVESATPDEPSP